MEVGLKDVIIAAVSRDKDKVGGDIPIFFAETFEEQERIAMYLSRITGGVVHDLENGTYIIVKH